MKKAIILTNKLGLSCAKLSYGKDGYLGETYQDFSVCTPGQVVSLVKHLAIKRGFRIVTEHLSRRFGLENPLLLDFLEKIILSSVTHTTHKETSAVSDPGMLGQV